MKKRLMAMDSKLWTVTEIGLTDLCKMAGADDIRKYTLLNLTAKDVICSCLSRNQFRNVMHLNHAKLIWDRLSKVYESHLNRHDPWLDDYINFKFAIGMLGGVYCADIVKEIINILDILIAILSGVDFGNLVFS